MAASDGRPPALARPITVAHAATAAEAVARCEAGDRFGLVLLMPPVGGDAWTRGGGGAGRRSGSDPHSTGKGDRCGGGFDRSEGRSGGGRGTEEDADGRGTSGKSGGGKACDAGGLGWAEAASRVRACDAAAAIVGVMREAPGSAAARRHAGRAGVLNEALEWHVSASKLPRNVNLPLLLGCSARQVQSSDCLLLSIVRFLLQAVPHAAAARDAARAPVAAPRVTGAAHYFFREKKKT